METDQVVFQISQISETISRRRYFTPPFRREEFQDEESIKKYLIKECGWYRLYLDGSWNRVEKRDSILDYLKHDYLIAEEHEPRGMFIAGDIGVGKSTLMGLIAIWFCQNFRVIPNFSFTGALFDKVHERNYQEIENLSKCSLLFLDDLGIYAADLPLSKYENLIEYRYANLLPTFITSNISLLDLRKRAGFERIADRINDSKWMKNLIMMGKSKRMYIKI